MRSGPASEDPPAWARALLSEVAQLKEAANRQHPADTTPGEGSDTDTEFEKEAHKDQYGHNKRVASIFKAIKANPSKAVEFAEKGELIVAERNKILRIADSDGWDTVRIYLKKPLVNSEADKKKLKEARDQALSKRRGNGSRSRSDTRERLQGRPQQKQRTASRSPSPAPKRGWRDERRQLFFRGGDNHDNGSQQRLCFTCGKPGHFQRFCPERRQPVRGGGVSGGGLPQQ